MSADKSSTKTAKNVSKRIPKSVRINDEKDQVESKIATAEELTRIIPDMPQTNVVTGKSAKVLVWQNLVVSVPVMQQKSLLQTVQFWKKADTAMKEVLHGVSGVAEPGEILAIMGASGAGKSTLLNVLTHRNLKALDITGDVTVNGEILSRHELQRMSSYVQQADIFMGSVTVREHLIFSARLRMGHRFNDKQKIARVEEVITQMNLVNCQNTLIGVRHQKSISLGEKKRLAFAAEILTDPSILFCDEPTSGLDAFMAKQVLKALKELANQGKTIVITIHQPSSQVYDMFNKLCLMALGEIVYLGPAKKVVNIFKEAGHPMMERANPAEYCIEKLALQEDEAEEDMRERVMHIKNTYDESHMGSMYFHRIHGPVSERRKKLGNEDVRKGSHYAANWFTQVLWLTVRSFRATLRDPLLLKVRLVQTLLTAVMVGIVYWQMELNAQTISSYNGFLFNCVRDCIFMLIFPCLTVFTDEMPVFLREEHGNIYRTDAYFIGKNLAELPQYILLPLIYGTTVSIMSGILSFRIGAYFIFNTVCILATNIAISIGYAAACIFGTTEVATQILPLITMPIMIFGGFFVNFKKVGWLGFMKHISWHRYAYESHLINMWEDHDRIEGCYNGTYCPTNITLFDGTSGCVECPKGANGKEILEDFMFNTEGIFILRNFGILLFMILLFRSVAMGALFIRARLVR